MGYILIIWHMYTLFDDRVNSKYFLFFKNKNYFIVLELGTLECSQHALK